MLTTAGLYARVVEVGDTVVVLEPAPGTRIRWDRRAIASVVPAASPTDPTVSSTGATGSTPVVDTTKHLDPPPASTDEK
ncbi:hypothetical protein GCM10025868_04370 [Angustibacter aerolatus]|uniref:Preprotein translocase subunit YajC n=1 Tax=Angustibacter aerolatus TaxID=1162965 RepID=A0ABQ6JE57_9ACTN|nr:hypothetical protein GCM10025868_04370 [Angustibacter aerolatus]